MQSSSHIFLDRTIYIITKSKHHHKLRLKRGHILLLAGGTITAVSLGIFTYSTVILADSLLNDNRYVVSPGGSQTIRQFINQSALGAYIIGFSEAPAQLNIRLAGPSDITLDQRRVSVSPTDPPVFEQFQIAEGGEYSLIIANPSGEAVDVAAILGYNETIIQESGLSFATLAMTFISLLFVGIALLVAGAAITILDRRRINKMKQFGDTSDLV